MKAKQLLAALFCGLMILSGVSCGSDTQTQSDNTTTTDNTSAETATERKWLDNLPDDLNYNGEKVTFLYREEVADEFSVDSENGEIVNDAVFSSFRTVEERLNVDIEVVKRLGHYMTSRNEYMDHISTTVIAGDDVYDWVDLMIGNSPVRMKEGIFLNLLDNPMLDFDKPWYIPDMVNTVSINDRLFFISGDASLGYLKCAFCIYYNRDIAENLGVEDLYPVVEAGEWTLDKLIKTAALAAIDLNNDGIYTLDDKLGFVSHDSNHPKGFMQSTGSFAFEKNGSGEWEFVFGDEHDVNALTKLYNLRNNTAGSFFFDSSNSQEASLGDYNRMSSKFCNDEIFLISAEMDDVVSQFRSMTSEYGILPYPKYDEAQDSYHTASRNTHNAFSMPITCSDPEMAGAVYEALGAEKYRGVLPTYFEVALKTKYSADNATARMFDIIHDSMMLDFAYIYSNATGKVDSIFIRAIKNIDDFSSQIAANTEKIKTTYASYLQTLEENCGNL